MNRRNALQAASATLVAALGGCTALGTGADDQPTDSPSPTDAPDATVEVGPDGELVFSPGTGEPLAVAPGATVEFVWRSDSHNVVVDSMPDAADWGGSPGGGNETYDEGYRFTHTFDVEGRYEFYCQPHQSIGMIGSIVVGATPTPGPVHSGTADVAVGPGGELVFEPDEITVEAGTTLVWTWESDNHNVVVANQPEEASWQGTEGGDGSLYDEGHAYEHTFEVPGRYEYYCTPHQSAGMVGSVVVR